MPECFRKISVQEQSQTYISGKYNIGGLTMKKLTYKPLGNSKRSYRQDKFIISTFKINGRNGEDLSYDDAKRIVKNLKKLIIIKLSCAGQQKKQYLLQFGSAMKKILI